MAGSTISGTIDHGIDLGSASYSSPLTISATGAIIPGYGYTQAFYAAPVVGPATLLGATLINDGRIIALSGPIPFDPNVQGIDLQAADFVINAGTVEGAVFLYHGGEVTNSGVIAGIDGEFTASSGLDVFGGGTAINSGTISGGGAGFGFGAVAVQLGFGSSLYNTGMIVGGYGVFGARGVYGVATATIVNAGLIQGGGGADRPGMGIFLTSGAGIVNRGTILGGDGGAGATGMEQYGGLSLNEGLVEGGVSGDTELAMGTAGTGLTLAFSGTFMNTGTVAGGAGTYIVGGSGPGGDGADVVGYATLVNDGLVVGGVGGDGRLLTLPPFDHFDTAAYVHASSGGAGVSITSATLLNAATITGGAGGTGYYAGLGGVGVYAGLDGTVVNTGLIGGGVGGDTDSTLGVSGGAGVRIDGAILFNAGTIAGDPGQVAGVRQPGYGAAVDFAGAGTLVENPGAVLLGSLAGFAAGDVIILPSFGETGFSYVSGVGLELDTAGTVLTLDLTGSFSTGDFLVTDDTGATTITLQGTTLTPNPCFTAGTRILTPRGEVAVEALAVGDAVINRDGEDKAIIWIGRRDLDIGRHRKPETVRPVIIEAGALADGVPARRLVVSPDHALLLDGVLVQAKDLLNGRTIRPDAQARRVRYYHVELAAHDILFAEGAAVESYLDTGHRGAFDNAEAPLLLHPDLMQQRRQAEGCAKLCLGGAQLAAIRQRLARLVRRVA